MANLVILCVDDEPIIRDSLLQQLKGSFHGEYDCETAEDAAEALAVIEEVVDEGNDLVVIVSDWLMPGMKGDEFLIDRLPKIFPPIQSVSIEGLPYRCFCNPYASADFR